MIVRLMLIQAKQEMSWPSAGAESRDILVVHETGLLTGSVKPGELAEKIYGGGGQENVTAVTPGVPPPASKDGEE
jgi:hypothetical protein